MKTIMVDFAGTLIKPEILDEANKFRSLILQRSLPTNEEHANPKELYKINNEFVEKLTGINSDFNIQYRKNDLETIKLTGDQVQTQIATNLFQIGMYMAAKKHGKAIFEEGMFEELKRMIDIGFKILIETGVREDIVSGMLQIANIDLPITIIGQPPVLGVSGEDNQKDLKDVKFIIGDKPSDIASASKFEAKSILVTWGSGDIKGGDADFIISKPEELKNIIN